MAALIHTALPQSFLYQVLMQGKLCDKVLRVRVMFVRSAPTGIDLYHIMYYQPLLITHPPAMR